MNSFIHLLFLTPFTLAWIQSLRSATDSICFIQPLQERQEFSIEMEVLEGGNKDIDLVVPSIIYDRSSEAKGGSGDSPLRAREDLSRGEEESVVFSMIR